MKIFKLPDLGEGLQEAEIVSWHVNPGDHVVTGQPLVSVETAKAIVEVPTPFPGRINRLFGKVGDVVRVGDPLAGFGGDEEAADTGTVVGAVEVGSEVVKEPATPAPARAAAGIKATPAVRALARRLNVDLAMVTPTGRDGLITGSDVERVARILAEAGPQELLRGVRKFMAQNMTLANAEVASATVVDDADLHAWGPGQDVTVRLIRALIAGCRAEPGLNCWYDSEAVGRRVLKQVHLGLATDSPEGLFVPVIRNAETRAAEELRREVNRLRDGILKRSLAPEELRGNSITLSNFGTIAGRYAAPVVLPPTVAILGAGRLREEVVAVNGHPAVHRVLPLSLTFDHRAVTGGEAGRFLAAVITDLQKPE